MQVSLYVASHEVGGVHQVCGADRRVAETEVRAGETARLLGVVCEVCLAVLAGVVADDLDGVLVCTYSTVGAETEELGLVCALVTESHLFGKGKRCECHIVNDTYCEVVLGHGEGEVLIHADDLGGCGVFRRQTVTAAYDQRGVLLAVEAFLYIKVKGLAVGTGFLGAVKHCDALCCGGHSGEEMLGGEGAVEVHGYQTYFLTLGDKRVDGFLGSLCDRAHGDDHTVCILCAVVVEEAVFAAGDLGDLVHIFLHNLGHTVVCGVACLAVLEEDVAVLSHTARYGSLGCEATLTETCESLAVEQRSDIVLVHSLDLLDLMRCAETVEEVHEGDGGFDGGEVCHSGEVHNLLHGAFAKHGEACLAHRHNVLMVSEDTQRMRSERTGRNMENAGELLACDLVHVGDHKEETLRSCIGCGEGTCLERAVNGTCGTTFRLHLLHEHCLTEDILTAGSSPFVNVFRHG